VLAAVRAAFPAARSREATGIDGVSLGGRLALDVGLAHPEAFGAVGALQPAFDEAAMQALVDMAATRPATLPQQLRIVTSDGDTGRAAAQALSASLREKRVEHALHVATGAHGYAFNRGPGAIEMLLFHDAALAAERADASPPR
jgi:enterochelin esterase-like enzyme